MKSALRSVLTITSFTATAVLPSALHAQLGGIQLNVEGAGQGGGAVPITLLVGSGGNVSLSAASVDRLLNTGQHNNAPDLLQQILRRAASDGKHPLVVLDSAPASENDLISFSQSLRAGKVRIKPGGVRMIAGDSKEAEKYGAKADDRVVLISTEPGGATAPADSGAAKHK